MTNLHQSKAPTQTPSTSPAWRMLMDTRSPWLVEFARAIAGTVPTRVYSPEISLWGRFRKLGGIPTVSGSISVVKFPLQRGYFSPNLSPLVAEDRRILSHMAAGEVSSEPLICCFPHYARVAELWRGPVVYYATDLFRAYTGWSPAHIRELERRICQTATLVCPNSTRIANVLVSESGCDPNRILVLPNAVRSESLLPKAAVCAGPLPRDIEDIVRPVAGVIGNLAENTDWELVEQVVESTPWLSWLFVGPYSAPIKDAKQANARLRLLGMGGRVRFAGAKSYGDLKDYARSVDVAILPYRKREPTYSGSSTRFYEHLAACRPMIATRGFEELIHKSSVLRLVDSHDEFVQALEELRSLGFEDGLSESRWRMSIENTWELRAQQMCSSLLSSVEHSRSSYGRQFA